jgi:putative MATE family efflux protein
VRGAGRGATPPGDDPSSAPAGFDDAIEEPEDPEALPAIPSASVAAHASWHRRVARQRTDREIWMLAWPVILSQIMASAVSLIDIAMLGRLGPDALAAVGYVTQFFWLAQAMLMAVGIACVARMSRALGAGAPERARAALGAAMAVALALSAAVAAIVILAPRPLLALLNADPAVAELAIPYLRLTLASTVLFAVSIVMENGFRAVKDTRTPMWIAAGVTVIKTGLNAVLIFGLLGLPRLDLVGAGLATAGAQVAAVALLGAAARRSPSRQVLALGRADLVPGRDALQAVTRIATPAILERLVLNAALMAYFAVLAHYGSAALAAYTIGVRVLSFSWIPGTGFAAAAGTLVGHELGAGDARAAARAGWRAARFALLVSIALGLAFAAGRVPLARVFTDDPSVVEQLKPFMLLLALAQPLLGVHFTLGGALRGAGDTMTPLLAATLGNWGFRVPLAFLVAHGLEWSVVWVWAALAFDHLARAIWLVARFRSGCWARARAPAPRAASAAPLGYPTSSASQSRGRRNSSVSLDSGEPGSGVQS